MTNTVMAAIKTVRPPTRNFAWLAALALGASGTVAGFSIPAVGAISSHHATRAVPAYCHSGGQILWDHLVTCGWPGESNTGPILSDCPGRRLVPRGNGTDPIVLNTPDQVIRCADLRGPVMIQAANVTITNSAVETTSGTGDSGTASIFIGVGASATISYVNINGGNTVHACIWHEGTYAMVKAVDCFGANDGMFTWAATNQPNSGSNFIVQDSYFHAFTKTTANGHDDGFQTEGSSHGLINHNTFRMTPDSTSAIAIWDSRANANDLTVSNNLIAGGGFSVYAEDYNPGDGAPADASPVGGFSVTNVQFDDNSFSTVVSGCVGKYGVWFTRPTWELYQGGPTDGWHRLGNVVLETGENIDSGNPHSSGQLCR
jgi:hypothetical protein